MGKLYVVRHADAGHRSDWDGRDEERPVSERGRKQSLLIRDELAGSEAARLVSSPYTRCIQTLEPLGKALGVAVEADERLGEGARTKDVLTLVDELRGAPAVICSHGDVIPDLLEALLRDGLKVKDELRWQKASTWVLTREGGHFAKGRYLPPPA